MLVTPSLSHCSNKYKLAREGEKDKGPEPHRLHRAKIILIFLISLLDLFILVRQSVKLLSIGNYDLHSREH